ncbi:MAG: Hsp70 family protein [Parachlamydiaceae bacterium]|nr:Hsp70 family protein [Parachlamydiaceae bacterium]
MRYIIGIDLGTTNSSVAYVDTQSQHAQIQQFLIPQLVAAGYIESLPTLPSFCYLCAPQEWPKGSIKLKWKDQEDFFVGKFAQEHGGKVPTRLVQSAKSWLCHAAANRREKILPFESNSSDTSQRISPVEASLRYLSHIKEAWNATLAKGDHTQEFEEQEIVLTVPASFDEIARRLTAEAALQAGIVHLTLLEEPQAAFYSWLAQNESTWQKQLPLGSTVLVCDVGGGTTDFSLIEVAGEQEKPQLRRMAVGDHLLLGGDNMDAALAHHVEPQLFKEEPSAFQWLQLKSEVRAAKEVLLDPKGTKKQQQIILQGSGASVIKNSLMADVFRDQTIKILQEGFFGQYEWKNALDVRKTTGMRTMGLPYDNEPSITKHLACFLSQGLANLDQIKGPDFVLFNGGTMKPLLFQEAILNSLQRWFPNTNAVQLSSYHLDLAVARGAAYYGKVRRGIGVKITGGTARGYYLGVDTKGANEQVVHRALTLLPRGSDEGTTYEPKETFLLRPNKPVSFQLYTSHVRLHDLSGDLIAIDPEQLQPLPPIHTILRFGKNKQDSSLGEQDKLDNSIPVHLAVHLNAIGTLEVSLRSLNTEHVWVLEFQLRSATGQEDSSQAALSKGKGKTSQDELFDQEFLVKSKKYISEAFSLNSSLKPENLMDSLEKMLQKPRRDWSLSIRRGLSEAVFKVADKRKLTLTHETRWWNLLGFLMLPGCGFPLDDFRIKELWKIILSESKTSVSEECQVQKWICYRRVAAGFNKGQQLQLAHELLLLILNKRNGKIEVKGKSDFSQYGEKIRALAALELMDLPMKIKVGEALVERITKGKPISADYWALGRIGARHLLNGTKVNVVPKDVCARWIDVLLALPELPESNVKELPFLISQLGRKTDSREINLSQVTVDKVLRHFADSPDLEMLEKCLLELTEMTEVEQDRIFGEHLPAGLLL